MRSGSVGGVTMENIFCYEPGSLGLNMITLAEPLAVSQVRRTTRLFAAASQSELVEAKKSTKRMKLCSRFTLLLGVLIASSFAPVAARAQRSAVVPRLKGIGHCDIPGRGIDVQVVENVAYMAWSAGYQPSGTNDPGGFEIFRVSNPTKPVRVGGGAAPR